MASSADNTPPRSGAHLPTTATEWAAQLALKPHPEGGYFREVYRAAEGVPPEVLPERYGGPRDFGTSIYFLMSPGHFSAFHRLQTDELWYFHAGVPCRFHVLQAAGTLWQPRLGLNVAAGEAPCLLLPGRQWFAVECLAEEGSVPDYTLVSCALAPGFEYDDFELAEADALAAAFPAHKALIHRFCRA